MDAKGTLTGRSRRRKRPWDRFGDTLARVIITAGGIGTIVAVLLVGVFLLVVAAPLFRPARATPQGATAFSGTEPLAVGSDESGSVVWILTADGVRGISVADGATLLERPAAASGLEGCSAVCVAPGSLMTAVGYRDGSFRTGRLGLDSTYIGEAGIPEDQRPSTDRKTVLRDDAVIVRGSSGQLSRVSLVTDLTTAGAATLPRPIIDLDVAPLATGSLVAVLDEGGAVRVESSRSRLNMVTGQRTVSVAGATISPADNFRPRFVRVSELGDQLFLIAADGTGRRYVIRDIENPKAMESFSAGGPVTAVARLFGGTALAVARDDGTIMIMFTARRDPAVPHGDIMVAKDGLRMVTAREFPPAKRGVAVTAIASSPRSRLFAAADAEGGIRLLQSTAGREVVSLPRVTTSARAHPIPSAIAIADQENRVFAAGRGGLAAWAIDVGYPEVSLQTLLMPVWYESYPGPVQAWETTGHGAFESKFGLLPLIFGTIKATIYSMLFAAPIALLAAIYTSQFMHPAWRARVKPTIEMMASLPSVVLGFVAGLVFAPFVDAFLMPVLTAIFVVPAVVVIAAHAWQILPVAMRSRLASGRFAVVALVALPLGLATSWAAAPVVERLLFEGDVRAWLDGRGSGFGGWVVATLPLAAIATVWLVGVAVNPWLRQIAAGWSRSGAAVVSLGVVVGSGVAAVLLAMFAASFFSSLGLETRGGMFGTYVQRNAVIVALGMSFAIIPIVFTIADDALASVPEHLRSASLGAGATPWQTAIRVIVPTAASGLFSAVMIGLGRAVGETMVVLMAAGNTPIERWNMFNGFQTLSAAIATELPEAAQGSSHYRVLFLAALVLFVMTFVVNTVAELVRLRFRRRAHEL